MPPGRIIEELPLKKADGVKVFYRKLNNYPFPNVLCSKKKDFYCRAACGLFLFSLILKHLIEQTFLIKLYLEELTLKDIQWQNLQW